MIKQIEQILVNQLESNAPNLGVGIVIMAQQLKRANLVGVLNVLADAEALVVVAYLYHAHGLGGIVGQAFHVEAALCLGLGDVLGGDGQVLVYHLVHCVFQLLHLLWGGAGWQLIVQFALLTFDVGFHGASAAKEVDHRSVDDVLGSVHWGVFLLIVLV